MEHRVTIDEQGGEPRLSRVFNAAVAFVDRHVVEGHGARVAIRTTAGDAVTYAELAERVGRCGNALRELGVARGDRVLMIVKDSPAFFYLFWGAIKAGIIPVPVSTLLRRSDYEYMIADSEARVVVCSPEFASELPVSAPLVLTEGDGDTLAARMSRASGTLAPVATGGDDDCFWLYSSGSTGRPKGAVHAHRSPVVTSQRYGVEVLGMREQDLCFSAAKLFFAYGLGNAMTFPLWVGGTALLMAEKPTPVSTLAAMERWRPTLYFGVPTLYAHQLVALEGDRAPELSSLRLCVSAGEALPPDLLHRWRAQTGLRILDGIGSTEALHIFISNRADDVRPGSSGVAVPGYEARVVGEGGQEVAPGEPGQLMIRGGSIAKYYWKKPEKTARTMRDGWLATGDTYRRDADGYYIYCGRNDDMMKVGGIWCSPFEIEATLVSHPLVVEAAVVARANEDGLIKPEAWIVLRDPDDAGAATERALVEHCRRALARYKFPRWFRFVTALPKTSTGKVQRFKLRARSEAT